MTVSTNEIAKLFPLEGLRPETRQQLARDASGATYRKGEVIFRAGDLDDDTFYVLDGIVRCDYPDGRSTEHRSDSLVHGRYPLNDAVPRRFTATVASLQAKLLRINRRQTEKLIAWDQISRAPGFRFFDPSPNGNLWVYRLLQSAAFAKLPTGNLEKMFQAFEEVPVAPSQTILTEGDAPDYFYVIREGTASVSKNLNGSNQVVAYLSEGDAFGEDALLSNQPRNATVRMMQGGKLMRLSREAFEAVLKPPLIQWVLPADAANRVKAGAVLLDVRMPEEFSQRAIDGALNVPLFRLREDLPAKVAFDKPVIVYCNTGERSAAAAFVLTRAGYQQVSAMHGGLSAMLRLIAQQQAAAAG